jgi:PiT family inorganic phosphate transporter
MGTTEAAVAGGAGLSTLDEKLSKNKNHPAKKVGGLVFFLVLVGGLVYTTLQIIADTSSSGSTSSAGEYVLLGVALLIALGFEFVNGFHDTANAVATVIYTHSLVPEIAVVWSGCWNLIGVLTSSGTVAFTILTLLPVELILQVGRGSGFSMVFALLLAAITWNLGTWWLGLPASSSHTMIGSIIGVGIANQLMQGANGTSGVDWSQVTKVFQVLLISPVVGFTGAFLLLFVMKFVIRDPRLYKAPEGTAPPPFWIRCLLILTCTGVSYSHGSNDGQKGMGLIMLILIGTVPTAYALNHAVDARGVQDFVAVSQQAIGVMNEHIDSNAVIGDARSDVTQFIRDKNWTPNTLLAMRQLTDDIQNEVSIYKALKNVPPAQQTNVRNDMYMISEALRLEAKNHSAHFTAADETVLGNYKKKLDTATKFIPVWVKFIVALALGLGTMVGWKRIVVTVGEKIGKEHLTYAQGATAEIMTWLTIQGADNFGMPVSTTHVLSSGIAGTMMANGSGLQWSTVRNIAMAWVFTLPAAALLSGGLFWALRSFTNL